MPIVTIDNETVTVDEQDLPLLVLHKWRIRRTSRKDGSETLSVAFCKSIGPQGNNVRTLTYLHKLILGDVPPGKRAAFRDGNHLNLSRSNLFWANAGSELVKTARSRSGTTRYPCPFSTGRLQEMHWRDKMNLEEIGLAAQQIEGWDRTPSPGTVKLWLEKSGVRNRTLSEVIGDRTQSDRGAGRGLFSEQAKAATREAARKRHEPILIAGQVIIPARRGWNHTAAAKRKMSEAARSRTGNDSRITKLCEHCSAPFLVYPSRAAKRFCSRKCSAARNRVERVVVPCDNCGKETRLYPSRLPKSNRHYCGKSCATTAANQRRDYSTHHKPHAAAVEAMTRRNHSRGTGNWQKCSVPECANEVYVQPYQRAKHKTFTCSRACAGAIHSRKMQARHQGAYPEL